MTNEGTGKERHADFRKRFVAELPHAAIKGVHELAFTGENTDRQTSGDNFAVGRKVGADSKDRLAATLMRAKSCDDLIKDQRSSRRVGNLAKLLQELDRLQSGVTALYWFDKHRSKIVGILPYPLKRRVCAVVQHNHVRH